MNRPLIRVTDWHTDRAEKEVKWSPAIIVIHWLTAIMVLFLFPLGLWMTELGYYDPWFQKSTHIHESVGIMLIFLTVLRVFFRRKGVRPVAIKNSTSWTFYIVSYVHLTLYCLLIGVLLSGYLASTADGNAIIILNWIEIPATIYGLEKQADIAGQIHLILSICFISVVILHASAAIKHHYYDKDHTLKRMFKI